MSLLRIFNKAIFFVYYLFKFRNISFAFNVAFKNIHPRRMNGIELKNNSLFFTKTNTLIPISIIINELKHSLEYLIDLFNEIRGVKIFKNENGVVFELEQFSAYIDNISNAGSLYELYYKSMYKFTPYKHKNVLLDIGMNTGLATLYFASMPEIAKVFSYEPFPTTFSKAEKNFKLNKAIQYKIQPFNFGVSNKTNIVKVPLFEEESLEASVNPDFIKQHNFSSLKNEQFIELSLVSITDVVEQIVSKEDADAYILKLDCEGEEYNILEEMKDKGLIKFFSIYLIEWHHKGSKLITEILHAEGFSTLLFPETTVDGKIIKEAGMIYAFRN